MFKISPKLLVNVRKIDYKLLNHQFWSLNRNVTQISSPTKTAQRQKFNFARIPKVQSLMVIIIRMSDRFQKFKSIIIQNYTYIYSPSWNSIEMLHFGSDICQKSHFDSSSLRFIIMIFSFPKILLVSPLIKSRNY